MTETLNFRAEELYDRELALVLSAGLPQILNRIVSGIVGHFSADGDFGDLLDVDHYASNAEHVINLAHRAAGLAGQAAMPALRAVCKDIESALQEGDIESAQALGRQIGTLVERISEAAEVSSK